jgi:hypothetical protein
VRYVPFLVPPTIPFSEREKKNGKREKKEGKRKRRAFMYRRI